MKFAALGEILFDRFPDRAVLGGAPVNVCCMMRQFGAESFAVSAVGDDAPGEEARRLLAARGVRLDALQTAAEPTGAVHVSLDAAGKASYRFDADSAWDHIRWNAVLEALAPTVDALIWGSLAQRNAESKAAILRFLRATRPGCLKVFDVNLRAPFHTAESILESIPLADVVKFNDEELPVIARYCAVAPERLIGRLFEQGVRLVALSLGANGAELHSASGAVDRAPAAPVPQLADTVGAGDAYTATLIQGLTERRGLSEINRKANEVAAFVCGRRGATPELPENLRRF